MTTAKKKKTKHSERTRCGGGWGRGSHSGEEIGAVLVDTEPSFFSLYTTVPRLMPFCTAPYRVTTQNVMARLTSNSCELDSLTNSDVCAQKRFPSHTAHTGLRHPPDPSFQVNDDYLRVHMGVRQPVPTVYAVRTTSCLRKVSLDVGTHYIHENDRQPQPTRPQPNGIRAYVPKDRDEH